MTATGGAPVSTFLTLDAPTGGLFTLKARRMRRQGGWGDVALAALALAAAAALPFGAGACALSIGVTIAM